jgi:hypothetical protein
METIKEAEERVKADYAISPSFSDELIDSHEAILHLGCAFRNAVAWAERWIPVEEELPDNQDIVLVKTDKGCVSTAYLHGKKYGFICYGQEAYNDFGEVTHWRPINHE